MHSVVMNALPEEDAQRKELQALMEDYVAELVEQFDLPALSERKREAA